MSYDRRTFLHRAGLLAAAGLVGPGRRAAAQPDEGLAPFYHGVASGDPHQRRVVLWTRVTPEDEAPVDVDWRVATDLSFREVVAEGRVTTDGSRDWTVKVQPRRLEPGRWYYYDFTALGRRSLVGRTKTLPRGRLVERLRFGVVSCANFEGGYFNAYARLAERNDLDAILHLGDYLYEYAPGEYGPGAEINRVHVPAVETYELATYRARYAQYHLDPDLRRLHQLFPFIPVWDDHEAANDAWKDGAANHQPASEGSWEDRERAARRAYLEWLPVRPQNEGEIYRDLPFGDLMHLVMLDTRLEGRDQQAEAELDPVLAASRVGDPGRDLISGRQRDWLFDTLSQSDKTWRMLGQQVMMMQWNAGALPALPPGFDVPDFLDLGGVALNPDAWDGYPAERSRVFDHVRSAGIENLVVLTGDIHSSWAADLTEDPYDPSRYDPTTGEGALGVEFVTPSITSANFNEMLGAPEGSSLLLELATLADNPHIKYVDLDRHGFVILDVDRERVQADWFFVRTLLEPDDGERTGPSWQVRNGAHHVEPAAGPTAEPGVAPPPPPAEPTSLARRLWAPRFAGGLGGGIVVASAALGTVLARRRGRGVDPRC